MHEQIKNINTLDELQSLYTATFGKNGTMTARLRDMKNLDNDARAALHRENTELRELFKTRQAEIENAVLSVLPSDMSIAEAETDRQDGAKEFSSSVTYILNSAGETVAEQLRSARSHADIVKMRGGL